MDKKGIETLKRVLEENRGAGAMISICHKLYGLQKVKCDLDYIFDTDRIGVRVKSGQELFIYRNDLINFGIEDGIYFADDMMEIKIQLHVQQFCGKWGAIWRWEFMCL